VENINLLKQTKNLLRHYSVFPKKRLGQNFTVDSDIFYRLISYASLTQNDIVLEVGAGLGFLTQILSRECKKVIAVEIDPQLMTFLRKRFYNYQNVELLQGDILNISIPKFHKVVSTPPYSISSQLLFHLLEIEFEYAVLLLQKEFAERLVASVGTKDYGRLTINIYYRADIELLDIVPRTMFYPQPDVDSIVVRLKPRSPPFQVDDETIFFELVRMLFTQRNKKVRNALTPFLFRHGMAREDAIEFADTLVYSSKRVQKLTPEDFGILTNDLLRKL
jgi:16S rRNA (adenine1518-N6/adenine1519-N6)-dimethyltransferase